MLKYTNCPAAMVPRPDGLLRRIGIAIRSRGSRNDFVPVDFVEYGRPFVPSGYPKMKKPSSDGRWT